MTHRLDEHSNVQTLSKANTRLWHKDVLLPPLKPLPVRIRLWYSKHAKAVSQARGIRILGSITTARFEIVEVETKGHSAVKFVLRGNYNETHDIVVVLIPQHTGDWLVKTVWLNRRGDSHNTLNRSRYVRG